MSVGLRSVATALLLAAVAAPAAWAAFPDTPPNDPLFDASPLPNATNEQWDLASPAGGFDRGISADRAWPITTGAGVTIADIDVGVDLDHPDLAGRFAINPGESGTDPGGRDRRTNGLDDDRNGYVDDWRGYDFYARDSDTRSDTRNSHGTQVASVLGAAADNGVGMAGVAPGASILPLRSADNILHQSSRLAEAMVYAADRGAGVMSMSLGTDSASSALYRAADYATRRGAVLVAASGNEFHFHHNYPAVLDDAITVGGLNPDTANSTALSGSLALVGADFKVRAAYSDYGPHLDVVAPTQVPAAEYGGGYTLNWSGTSAATPHVAGVAALVLARGKALGLKLSAREVRQIVIGTAQDQADPAKGTVPGWDQLTGYGRVDAFAAVSRVAPGKIPPEVDIDSPSWYEPAGRRAIHVTGVARGRAPVRWTLEVGEGEEPAGWRTLATGRTTGRRSFPFARIDPCRLPAGGHTLRLRATDTNGNTGEDRAFFFALRDPTLKRGYPVRMGSSGESSPQVANVTGGRRAEIVTATTDGVVTVRSGRTGRALRGWPRTMRRFGSPVLRRRIGVVRQGFAGTPAVGDIAGGKGLEIVASGLDGRVYAWSPRGRRVRGFPVRIDARRPEADGKRDTGIYASPALANLGGDRRLDIVVGATDQKIYAWTGRGRRLPGWPVAARDPAGDAAKILSSPAVGDLNGDGSPDVVEGTAEAYGSTPNTTGRVYAFNSRGQPLPGWPVKPEAIAAEGIPLAGEGVPMSPSLADVDGDGRDEVAVSAFTGRPELYRGDGSRMSRAGEGNHFQSLGRGGSSPSGAPAAIAVGANAAFGRTAKGGPLRLFGGMLDARLAQAQVSPASRVPFDHLLGGWDARSGDYLPAFPRTLEGWAILSGPAVADVDGDGAAEAIAGSSGYRLHAFGESGDEPPGWPKQTGGWLIAAPAVADVDGDRKLEVVAVTREGWLFAWNTPAPRTALREWSSLRHDRRNSGRYR